MPTIRKFWGIFRITIASAALFSLGGWKAAHAGQLPSAEELHRLAPASSLSALRLALNAYQCASARLGGSDELLTVIDYSKPSRDKRLWVFDLRQRKLLFEEWVTHGKNSGDDLATSFSNRVNSYQSSIGLYQTGETYRGKHGRSLRLQGLEPGFNDNSMDRAIVMHAAAYADPKVVPALGRLGRSEGCPAVRPAVAQRLIDTLQNGSYVFAYYPQKDWLKTSQFLAGSSCSVMARNSTLSPDLARR
ncbi:murein L,D-transpeptidase catalytic domain family protein [Pseudomonas schmalbachii]|uniref:Murein L,D-transpeptidase catalytic domain family protein n=1 Tax=Pseudomonas schmalbachii TaxID=2816993 RepID=A0ABS3TUG1_9PSED|nr:murein L,D-transpeptidase catalytic domain family protein [Pseudomonas schmalbachii]MBO3277300.1 murein L,D-transpeptidase catalytic domain family protein [Pseudomonas schmalbachii]